MNGIEHDTGQLLRRLVDHLPSMLAYWDRDLRCRFANQAYERWFGVNPNGLIGTRIQDLLGGELFSLNEPYIRAALAGTMQEFERVVPGPGGVRRHSLATYVPDVVGGEVVGFMAHVTEVTRLKEAEALARAEVAQRERALDLLHASESALRQAQRLGRIGSWDWEIEPDIATWSPELYHIFGRDPRQLPPKFPELRTLYTDASWQRLRDAAARTVADGEPFELDLEYRLPHERTGWVEARGEAVRDETRQIVRLRGTVLEISHRRQAEEARRRAQSAEMASRNKTELMARVSHDLRTPLNAILGFAQLFRSASNLEPKQRQWAELLFDAGKHMLDLVEEVLDLSAAESGRITMQPIDLDVVPLVCASVRQFTELAKRGGVELIAPGADTVPTSVRADPMRLKQALDNLLSNAIKYTGPGGRVSVTITPVGDAVEVKVQDTGVGLSPDQLERLFQPFERLGAEATPVAGTGLGLALTRNLIAMMGGAVRVSSIKGQGSSFVLAIPGARH
jgi:PAS domain S-box-containing protein